MFVIEIPYFSLEQTFLTNQKLRWLRVRENKFVVFHKDKSLKIEQNKEKFIIECSALEFYDVWFNYFDLEKDYGQYNFKLKNINKSFKPLMNRAKGIHIINQDLFEIASKIILDDDGNILSSICGYKRIQSIKELGKVKWYEFPTPLQIIENEDNLLEYYDKDKLDKLICLCYNMEAGLDLRLLKDMENKELREIITNEMYMNKNEGMQFCLFGLNNFKAMDSNKLVKKKIPNYYDNEYLRYYDWCVKEGSNSKGLLSQYLYYNLINPPKEV